MVGFFDGWNLVIASFSTNHLGRVFEKLFFPYLTALQKRKKTNLGLDIAPENVGMSEHRGEREREVVCQKPWGELLKRLGVTEEKAA